MEFVKAVDGLSKLVKFVLTFFFDPIIAGIYRILKGKLIIGILWIITGSFFGIGWIIDLITVALDNKYTVLV
ncbi:MAG: TM2 domain-containing protein [Bacilli bacterium]